MTALLEVPAIRQRAKRFSVADYQRLSEGQRTELLRGTIIEKMSKSPLHRFVTDHIREILAGQITPEFIVFSQDPMTTADSEPEPDVMVVKGTRAEFRTAHPTTAELVIEVAVSSLEIDRVKAHIYAEAGVKEYWIVCPEEKCAEVYRKPGADGYAERTTVAPPATIECGALPGVRVDLAALLA
jgi:Uma2 family endonuclease